MDPNACIQKCFSLLSSAFYLQLRQWIELRRVRIAWHENHRFRFLASKSQIQVVGVRLSHSDRLWWPFGRVSLLSQRVVALGDEVSENRFAFRTVALENGTWPLHLLRCNVFRWRRLLLGKNCRMSLGVGEKVRVLSSKASNKVRKTRIAFRPLRCILGH